MIRPAQIALLLMGGGMTLYAVAPPRDCVAARIERRPDGDAICHTDRDSSGHSSWYAHYYGSSSSSGASTSSSSATSASARGGFGAAGHAAAGASAGS